MSQSGRGFDPMYHLSAISLLVPRELFWFTPVPFYVPIAFHFAPPSFMNLGSTFRVLSCPVSLFSRLWGLRDGV